MAVSDNMLQAVRKGAVRHGWDAAVHPRGYHGRWVSNGGSEAARQSARERPTQRHTAFDLIGYDGDQYIRIVGGKTLYESIHVRDGYEGYENVRLVRLDGVRQINRYVDPDTPVELVDP